MDKCKTCNKEIINEGKRLPKGFCSYKCYEEFLKWNREPNCECAVCHKKMYLKPYRLKRVQNGITCSKECASIFQSEWMKGEGNHQFGLTGDKNASFKGNEIVSEFGYILEYCPEHPFPHDKTNKCCRVFQHRLVVERNADKFDDKYFIEINGNKYLKPEYSVHHINEIKTDNKLENLIILTRSEHSKIHNLEKEIIRDELGRIVGVEKLSKVGEICNDNPEVSSEITKGSETL